MIKLTNVSKEYPNRGYALRDISLHVKKGEFAFLTGHSGSGKSTAMRLVHMSDRPTGGEVRVTGYSSDRVSERELWKIRRRVGFVFQDFRLLPGRTALENISFVLECTGTPRQDIVPRTQRLLAQVGLSTKAGALVHELSGGEQQRVALARSLAPEPKLLMLDEPMGALDRRLREDLYSQVKAILKEVGVTAIYVTHDHDEAFAVSDRAVIMKDGKFIQIGEPEELYMWPSNAFIARFLGFKNLFPARLYSRNSRTDAINVETPIGVFEISADQVQGSSKVEEGTLLVPDESISIQNLGKPNAGARLISGAIKSKIFQQGDYRIHVSLGPELLHLSVRITTDSAKLALGDNLNLEIDSTKLMVLPSN